MEATIIEHERIATMESGLKSIGESLNRMEIGTLQPVRESLAALTKASIISEERQRGIAAALVERKAEVNERIDHLGMRDADNVAEHAVILRGMASLETALMEARRDSKDGDAVLQKQLDIFRAQGKIWFIVGTSLFTLLNAALQIAVHLWVK